MKLLAFISCFFLACGGSSLSVSYSDATGALTARPDGVVGTEGHALTLDAKLDGIALNPVLVLTVSESINVAEARKAGGVVDQIRRAKPAATVGVDKSSMRINLEAVGNERLNPGIAYGIRVDAFEDGRYVDSHSDIVWIADPPCENLEGDVVEC